MIPITYSCPHCSAENEYRVNSLELNYRVLVCRSCLMQYSGKISEVTTTSIPFDDRRAITHKREYK